MAFGLYLIEDVGDFAVGSNQERCAFDAPYLFAVHVLVFHDTEQLGYFLVGIAQ